jgi:exopolysaccharide production protein ExoZ
VAASGARPYIILLISPRRWRDQTGGIACVINKKRQAGVVDIHMRSIANRFELARDGGRKHVLSMEGLRGFAVFLVFLVHYASLIEPWLTAGAATAGVVDAIHTIGNAGVDLFFVLSGFLIYGSLIRRETPFLPYMRQRVTRIYPAFTVVFALYVALSFAMPSQSKIPAGAFAGGIYLLQNFLLLPGLFPIEAMITVAWSLSYEMFYYIVLPATILVFGLRQRRPQWRVGFFLAVAVVIVLVCALVGGPIRLVMFIAGILLVEAMGSGRLPVARSVVAMAVLFAGLATTLVKIPGAAGAVVHSVILAATFFTLCFCCFKHPDAPLTRAFTWTPMRWLGNMSYSYYLLHGLALKAGFMALGKLMPATANEPLFFLAMLVPMFVLTLIPTTLLFLFVERPFSLARQTPVAIAGRVPQGEEAVIKKVGAN